MNFSTLNLSSAGTLTFGLLILRLVYLTLMSGLGKSLPYVDPASRRVGAGACAHPP